MDQSLNLDRRSPVDTDGREILISVADLPSDHIYGVTEFEMSQIPGKTSSVQTREINDG